MTTSAARTLVVLDPTAPPRELRHSMALRLPDLRGRSVGFLWNSKPNGDILFSRLEELLRQKFEITNVMYRRKPTASIPAETLALEELAAGADAVVIGLGDWGSCTSWSIHDAIELERRGVPTVTVCTHLFQRLGEVERRALGMSQLPMAIAQHPLGGLQSKAVQAKADALLDQVVAGLTSN